MGEGDREGGEITMSINIINHRHCGAKIDAAGNWIEQLSLAIQLGDKKHQTEALTNARRCIQNALDQAEEMEIE